MGLVVVYGLGCVCLGLLAMLGWFVVSIELFLRHYVGVHSEP